MSKTSNPTLMNCHLIWALIAPVPEPNLWEIQEEAVKKLLLKLQCQLSTTAGECLFGAHHNKTGWKLMQKYSETCFFAVFNTVKNIGSVYLMLNFVY